MAKKRRKQYTILIPGHQLCRNFCEAEIKTLKNKK